MENWLTGFWIGFTDPIAELWNKWASKSTRFWSNPNFWFSVVMQILIALFFGWLLYFCIRFHLAWECFNIGLIIVLLLHYTQWTPRWYAMTKQNHRIVWQNKLRGDLDAVTDAEITALRATNTLHVTKAGFTGIRPWLEPITYINIVRSVPVMEKEFLVTTRNGVGVQVLPLVYMTAIDNDQGAKTLARRTEKYVASQIAKLGETYLEATVRILTDEELFRAIYYDPTDPRQTTNGAALINQWFGQILAGDRKVHPLERDWGVTTGKIRVSFILDKVYQKALQAGATAQQINEAVQKLMVKTRIDDDIALNTVNQIMGLKTPVTAFKIVTPKRNPGDPPGPDINMLITNFNTGT